MTPNLSLRTSVRLVAATATLCGLAACGGGSDSGTAAATVQLKGTAATGAAIANATLSVVDAKGGTTAAKTGADGSYTVTVADAAPYLVSIADAAGKVWYSYAPAAGTANITPLTTLALLEANGQKPLADLARNWASAALQSDAVLQAAKEVNANLSSVMQAKGVDFAKANIFADTFSANGQGLDAVLDALRVNISCSASSCTQTINTPQGQSLVTWNGNILTTGISVSWSSSAGGGTGGTVNVALGSCKAPVAGTYSLLVDTSVAGVGVPVPSVCVDGLPDKPSTQAEFCGAANVQQQLPAGVSIVACSYSGSTGSITARITSPVTLEYTVKYTYVKA